MKDRPLFQTLHLWIMELPDPVVRSEFGCGDAVHHCGIAAYIVDGGEPVPQSGMGQFEQALESIQRVDMRRAPGTALVVRQPALERVRLNQTLVRCPLEA